MKNPSKNYDKVMLALHAQMHSIGFEECQISEIPDPILYKRIGEILWLYQPDIMLRGGYIRISGSIGFSFIGKFLNEDVSIIDALNPMGGWMISIRLENFLSVMKSGVIESDRLDELPQFIESLYCCMSENLPLSIDEIKKMLANEASWLSIMIANQRSFSDNYPFRKTIASLDE